jgi:GT2 family glycosyltransferase
LLQNFDAVTAACLLIKKADFITVGGFDAINLKVAFNDVDLCLKIRQQNKKIVYCPDAILYHHESKSRGNDMDAEKIERFKSEINYMVNKWDILNN